MSETPVQSALAAMRAAHDALAACDIDLLTTPELLELLDEVETVACRLPVQWHRALSRLQAETTPKGLGAKTWNEVLRVRWRLSTFEAGRRLAEAAVLGPRRSLLGQPLEPVLPTTAVAQAAGAITAEHVVTIRDAVNALPGFVDAVVRGQIETDLVRLALGVGPKELKGAANTIRFLLDQDGPEPDDTERERARGVEVGVPDRRGMRPIKGYLTPEAWAVYEAIFAKLAAPGMCNPAEEAPCIKGTPHQAGIEADQRTRAQRQHDALIAIGRNALESGELGQHNGLPTSIIIRTTLADLESRAGVGVTGGGSLLPIKDVIRLAGHANCWLAVFDKATGHALDLYRSKRVASAAQRIMLIARDGGCTKPGCTAGPYCCQAHHANQPWAAGGLTNVDDLTLACGGDNRLVEEGGWITAINARGEAEWTPPPNLDTGQARINYLHRPELLLRHLTNPEPEEPVPTDPWDFEDLPDPPTTPGHTPIDFNPWTDDTDEPTSGTGEHGP